MRALVIALVVSLAAPALAQPAPDRVQERREKIKQRIRALRAYTLTEQLDLDPTTAGKLFPLLAKFDDEFDKLLLARTDIERRLRNADPKDPKLDKLIDEAVANQRALWDTEEKRLVQLRKILSPAQVARVLIVLPAMERKIQNQLRKAVQRQKAPDAVDPFADEDDLAPPPQRRPRAPGAKQPCDPFTSPTGCK
jgi:hypothetical protein